VSNELSINIQDNGDANGFLANLISALNSRSNAVITTAFPKRTFAASDFIRIPDVPGGLIIQFGSAIINSPTGTITFLPLFPMLLAFVPVKNSDAAARFITFSNLTNTATNLYGWTSGTTSNLDSFNWIAIGF
jgi:hypothetical protein